jgi:hypothetical protein
MAQKPSEHTTAGGTETQMGVQADMHGMVQKDTG